MLKQSVSVILALLLLLSVFSVIPVSAEERDSVVSEEASYESVTEPEEAAQEEPAEAVPTPEESLSDAMDAIVRDDTVLSESGAEEELAESGASYSEDWQYWSQGASDDGDMRTYGCWVTAQAKMLKEMGITDGSFNPEVYMNWERANGFLDAGFYQTNGAQSPITYAEQRGFSIDYIGEKANPTLEDFKHYLNAGFFVIVDVTDSSAGRNNGFHYIYVNNTASRDTGEMWFYQSRSDVSECGSEKLYDVYPYPTNVYVYSYAAASVHVSPSQPVVPESNDYEVNARYVPNFVNTSGGEVRPMFNPYTMQMLMDMSAWAYDLQDDYTSWNAKVAEKYGYTQFNKVINSGVYEIGEYTVEEEATDSVGAVYMRTVTKSSFFSAVSAGIALKPVSFNGKTKYAVVIAFRGSSDVADWLTDFRFIPNHEGIHRGFASNAEDFYLDTRMIHFDVGDRCMTLYDMIQDMKNPDSDFCLLVTGHSLGAALTDVFVGNCLYKDGINPRNVMAYTFAAPRSFNSERNLPYILNFVNDDDPVTKVGGSYRIGTDIVYTPDDAFRENYGDRTFAAHRCPTSYRPLTALLCAVDESGNAAIDSYTNYHTNGNVTFSNGIMLSSETYNHYGGNVTFSYSLTFYNGANVTVDGDCSVSNLTMNHDSDYLLANGNLSVYSGSTLSAGTVEVKGNSYTSGYQEGEGHKTKFTGDSRVSISSSDSSHSSLANAYFMNPNLYFSSSFRSIRLACNAVFNDSDITIGGTLDLNGYSLTTPRNVSASTFTPNGGTLNCAKLEVYDITLNSDSVINGNVEIYSSSEHVYFNGHKLTVNGSSSLYGLIMENDSDYLLANGNLSVYSGSTLSAGTVEVKGNFYTSDYQENDRHRTIFSGSDAQNIGARDTNSCRFNYLTLQNQSEEGVVFSSAIKVKTLFDHHQNHFTLYNSGSGSIFPDYDGDGAQDHLDMYPLNPYRIESGDGYDLLGDADGDGVVSVLDATCIQRKLARLPLLTDISEELSDIDGDGHVTVFDATMIQKWLAALPASNSIGKPATP